jgi:hypothetical protein
MGKLEPYDDAYVYRQEDGEITAWFENDDEKMVLSHSGDPKYKAVLYALVILGLLYLATVFY